MIRKINQTELVSVIVDERKRSPVTWQVNTLVIGGQAAAGLILLALMLNRTVINYSTQAEL